MGTQWSWQHFLPFFDALAPSLCTFLSWNSPEWKVEKTMEFLIVGTIAAGVLVYLIYALLYPEKF
jgi:K+-transporting ATPase KdpF subunit